MATIHSFLQHLKSRNFHEANVSFAELMQERVNTALDAETKALFETHDTEWDDKDPDNANRGKRCVVCKGSINAQQETKYCGPECQKKDMKESRNLFESKFRIYYADGSEEEFTGSAADVRAKVKKSTKEVDDVETIG